MEGLQDFKSAVDDIRLRVWAIMTASNMEHPQGVLDRFRIRRAQEICQSIARDLEIGALHAGHRELDDLKQTIDAVSRAIESARARA